MPGGTQVLKAKLDGSCGAWLLCPEGLCEGQSEGSLWKFQQSRLKKAYVFSAALVVFMQSRGKTENCQSFF